ncbi:MAG TPA: helix-turn-helix domain-containing protein [Jatrophihabitans sp.]|jgi:AcrR family transcriptional regulator
MSTNAIATPRPLRKDAARNRELLIAAAREVFASRGGEASLDEIAHHAGLGVGTAYRHFSNKHELIAAIIDQELERFVGLAEHARAAADPWTGLLEFFEAVLEVQSTNQGLREVLTGASGNAEDDFEKRVMPPLEELLRRAQRDGQVREDAEPSDLGFIILMLCTVSDVAGATAPNLWHRYLPMVLDGLRPGASALGAPALPAEQMQAAIREHKQAYSRAIARRDD